MSWAARRQLTILFGLLVIIGGILYWIFYPVFHVVPTCFDRKQNGTETGIDCGGTCAIVCTNSVAPIAVKFSRSFAITPTVYNALAYVENPNVGEAIYSIDYAFKLYDDKHSFITERDGTTYISDNGPGAIIETGIQVGNRTPAYTTFTFSTTPVFARIPDRAKSAKVLADPGTLRDLDTRPKLDTAIHNASGLFYLDNIDVAAILYDADGNAVGVSKTFVDHLDPAGTSDIHFTWQNTFTSMPVRNEIIPSYNAFTQTFQ